MRVDDMFETFMNSHTDAPAAMTTDVSDSSFDRSLRQWKTDEQWHQPPDQHMDMVWGDSRSIQERVDARLMLDGRRLTVRQYG